MICLFQICNFNVFFVLRKYFFFCIWNGKCLKKLGCMISEAENITFTKKRLLLVICTSHLLYIFFCLEIIILYFFALLWHLLFSFLNFHFSNEKREKSNLKKKCCLWYNILTVLLNCCLIQRKKGAKDKLRKWNAESESVNFNVLF